MKLPYEKKYINKSIKLDVVLDNRQITNTQRWETIDFLF